MEAAVMVLVALALLTLVAVSLTRTRRRTEPAPRARRRTPSTVGTDEILDTLDEGVIVFDDVLSPVTVNRAARSILGLKMGALPPRAPGDELLSVARRALTSGERVEASVEVAGAGATTVLVRAAPRPDGEGVVLTMRDTSREELVHNMRRQFVNHASHELKTPVASIRTLAEAVHDAASDDPQAAARLAGHLVGEAQRLGDLIRDLLELARVEDPGTIANRSVDLSDVARVQAEQAEGFARERKVALESDITGEVIVRGDANQLGLMIRNLLDNAIRYSENGGNVSFTVGRTRGMAVATITDEGIGIPLKDQARVFERFYRVDEARSRDHGGTGLGLAIVKHVAGLHGGRVKVQSAVGEGSTFTVTLPLAEQAPSTAPESARA